jgi:hypothetical protein
MTDQTLVQALVKAQSEMATPIKDKVNPQFKSKYASLGSIIDAVKGALNTNGIVFVQKSTPVDDGIAVETIFYGYGEEIATGSVHVPVDKVTAQGYGSAMTYAKRYSLAMACGVDADEDDDGNAAEQEAPKTNVVEPKPKPKAKKKEPEADEFDAFKADTNRCIDEFAQCRNPDEAQVVHQNFYVPLKMKYQDHDGFPAFRKKVEERLHQLHNPQEIEGDF